MVTHLIMLLVSYICYWAYTSAALACFGIPESYSNTFYLFNEKVKGLGWLFPVMSIIVVALAMPGWLEVSDVVLPKLTVMAFFSAGGLLMVAAAPFFKEMTRDTGRPLMDLIYRSFHGQGLVHTIGALMALIGTFTWIACSPVWYMLIIVGVITAAVMFITRTFKSSITFWVEFMIYNVIHISLFILHLKTGV